MSSTTTETRSERAEHEELAVLKKVSADTLAFPPDANANFDGSKYQRIQLTVDQFRFYKKHGWIKIPQILPPEDLKEINDHLDRVLSGEEKIPGIEIDPNLSHKDKQSLFSRIHQLHRRHPLHEKYLLHPRVLDVIEQLNSPDVLALQTISFFKEPGQVGQGYHQDSYYICTLPDTLIGAWVALTPATEENGCLWLSDGSNVEPLYPHDTREHTHNNKKLDGIFNVQHPSRFDENVNELFKVGKTYTEVAGTADAGDAFFFGGNLLHRSHTNVSKDSSRRAFTTHYCDARSFTTWDPDEAGEGEATNEKNILARGDTHLPFGKPRFGMPVELKRRMFKNSVAMPMGGVDGTMATSNLTMNQKDEH